MHVFTKKLSLPDLVVFADFGDGGPKKAYVKNVGDAAAGRIRSARGAIITFPFFFRYIILPLDEVRRDHRQTHRPAG
jgi:hypothetical protein